MGKILPPVFDSNKIVSNAEHAIYDVKYYLYHSENDDTDTPTTELLKCNGIKISEKLGSVCFAGLHGHYLDFTNKHKVNPNRLRYLCNFKKHVNAKLRLTEEEITNWVELTKKFKMLPENVGEHYIKTGEFDITIDTLSLQMLYIYLTVARYPQEEPFFVRAVLHMVNDCGMGFFTSFGAATKFCITNQGHHLLPEGREYGIQRFQKDLNADSPLLTNFDLIYTARLAHFLFRVRDKGTLISELKNNSSFNLSGVLGRIKLSTDKFKFQKKDLRKKSVEKALISAKPDTK